MERVPDGHWAGPVILASWAATEIFRYPMYILPNSVPLRNARMLVPLATFPVGAVAEFYGAYLVLVSDDDSSPPPVGVKVGLCIVLFVNGVLGPTMAYPTLLKKGLPVLGFGGTKSREGEKKKTIKRV